MLNRSSGVAPARYDGFFRDVPDEAFAATAGDVTDMGFVALVHVDEDPAAGADVPAVGWYVLRWDGDGNVFAHAYGEDEASARADVDDLYGDDPFDARDYQ